MPVLDHEVHASVIKTGNEPYGCANAVQKEGYWIQERAYRKDGTYVMLDRFIEHRMSKKCRNFYLWYKDKKCATCKRLKDRDYAQTMMHL